MNAKEKYQINRLAAVAVMCWHKGDGALSDTWWDSDGIRKVLVHEWNPLDNESHRHMVERRILDQQGIDNKYHWTLTLGVGPGPATPHKASFNWKRGTAELNFLEYGETLGEAVVCAAIRVCGGHFALQAYTGCAIICKI